MKSDTLYLRHIVDAIQKIQMYTEGGREAFMAGAHWQDAAIRQLEIIGEATKRLSPELRAKYPDVPWRRVAGLRDVLDSRLLWCRLNGRLATHSDRDSRA